LEKRLKSLLIRYRRDSNILPWLQACMALLFPSAQMGYHTSANLPWIHADTLQASHPALLCAQTHLTLAFHGSFLSFLPLSLLQLNFQPWEVQDLAISLISSSYVHMGPHKDTPNYQFISTPPP
jgi:hypothetical protein